jgi:hypothetical protein
MNGCLFLSRPIMEAANRLAGSLGKVTLYLRSFAKEATRYSDKGQPDFCWHDRASRLVGVEPVV